MTEPKPRSRHGCLWAVFLLLALIFFVGLLFVAGLFAITKSSKLTAWTHDHGQDEFPEMNEVWSEGDGEVKVVRIPLQGIIMFGPPGGFLSSETGSADIALRAIRRATKDDKVKAIILDIDSGGGGITASDILYKALKDFKAEGRDRVVVAVFNDLAASGAYYVALASDFIMAHPTTITGSIGVLMQSYNLKELAQKVGVKDVTIKSGTNKDLLNPFNEMSPEQRTMLQNIVDDLHSRFVGLVAENRELPEGTVRGFADGRIFTAADAVDLGLVDQIGYWADAVKKTEELLKQPRIRIYRYEEEVTLSSLFRAMDRRSPVSSILENLGGTRWLYLWQL
jgi:protease IV